MWFSQSKHHFIIMRNLFIGNTRYDHFLYFIPNTCKATTPTYLYKICKVNVTILIKIKSCLQLNHRKKNSQNSYIQITTLNFMWHWCFGKLGHYSQCEEDAFSSCMHLWVCLPLPPVFSIQDCKLSSLAQYEVTWLSFGPVLPIGPSKRGSCLRLLDGLA